MENYYITTPIYYPSDKLHIGHSYCTVATDTLARYKRLQGCNVLFLTGTDEHGQKIEEKASKSGKTPQKFVDDIVAGIKDLWTLMDISNDRFIRTTDDYHKKSVQKIFKKLYDKGEIYKSVYNGKYCTPCESFWTESQLTDGKCPDCGRDVKNAEEEAYFFRLSAYQDKILKLYEDHPDFLEPSSRKNEMINNFIKPGLEDLCVSRTTFKWGIPVDFDDNHVVYVWIDALSNYITALGYGNDNYKDFDKFWPADVHFVGKEITRFHAIIWPAMLMALGLPLPKKVFAHGWLLIDGGKMSKSFGNVVDPVVLCQRYGVDSLRYFLLREFPFGSDGVFTNQALINRINADLANDLGNLVSRTVAMVLKYFNGKLILKRQSDNIDNELISMASGLHNVFEYNMEKFAFQNTLVEIFKVISRANKYIDETEPWMLAKDENNLPRLASVMYNLLETIRICASLLQPFIPSSCQKIFHQICTSADDITWDKACVYGVLPADTSVIKGEPLFPRIDLEKELTELRKNSDTKESKKEKIKVPNEDKANVIINIEDFHKIKLLTAKVYDCEKIESSDKLLRLLVDLGCEKRQIVSGIATWYSPDDLIGKTIILVSNLKPSKLRGVLSEGMILAVDCPDGNVHVITVDDACGMGSAVR